MGSNYRMKYAVDLVFCIDATGSMGPFLDTVKSHALNFYQDLQRVMAAKGKVIDQLRVRVIAFRDYYYDKEEAMLLTNFFELPAQAEDFETCVKSIEAKGGGDNPEDGLEALAFAIKNSTWNTTAQKRRHIITVWSDDATHDLGFGKSAANYPRNMAKNFDELTQWWGTKRNPGCMDDDAKRLLLYTPDMASWNIIRENWNNVIHYITTDVGGGLKDCDYAEILNMIACSIN